MSGFIVTDLPVPTKYMGGKSDTRKGIEALGVGEAYLLSVEGFDKKVGQIKNICCLWKIFLLLLYCNSKT